MKFLKYILAGILFGIVMSKSEAISWYRMQEMFRFQAFFMYGIMGTAVVLGTLLVFLIFEEIIGFCPSANLANCFIVVGISSEHHIWLGFTLFSKQSEKLIKHGVCQKI